MSFFRRPNSLHVAECRMPRKVQNNLHGVEISRFSVLQILREINFREYRSPKTAVFANFGGSEFGYFGRFEPLKNGKIHKKSKFRASKCVKMSDLALLESPKLISRKI